MIEHVDLSVVNIHRLSVAEVLQCVLFGGRELRVMEASC